MVEFSPLVFETKTKSWNVYNPDNNDYINGQDSFKYAHLSVWPMLVKSMTGVDKESFDNFL